jgi:DNA-directed RNA polymerase specialized sigma24 family protein
MQALSTLNEDAGDPRFADTSRIYWLAFLLTGRVEASLDVATEALEFQDEANPFFMTWMHGWSRRVVIAKAMAGIRRELAESARRTASKQVQRWADPRQGWVLDPRATKVQLERALLAIDVFPRCALVLSLFEGIALDDVAGLLDSDRELVRKGQAMAVRELTKNLAAMVPLTSAAAQCYVVMTGMQNA